ncbi:MAG TPA: glycosyltransferase [Chitinophagaceae bacterium]|nr:glycosyltransferase [Chitinophagaceae bacterium]
MLLILTGLFLLGYGGLISFYFYHWLHINEAKITGKAAIKISVVVAARNEALNIEALLQALLRQTYPAAHFEIIIVDDFSTDTTPAVISPYLNERIHLIRPEISAQQSSKKKAIEAGVNKAKGELIVVTDADCIPGENWLSSLASHQQRTGAVFIAAPVKLSGNNSLLSIFQSLDFITLQGITAASVASNVHSMCNGANLAYLKESFREVNGFEGIDKKASGDDMLLMYKIWQKHPEEVQYLKSSDAIVSTSGVQSWKEFIWQRIRWSSKATYYKDKRITGVLLFIYLFNLFFFVLVTGCVLGKVPWLFLWYYLCGKTIIEFPFVYAVARFYKEQKLMWYFPFFQPLHIFYTVSIGLLSQFGTYQWKGRTTK